VRFPRLRVRHWIAPAPASTGHPLYSSTWRAQVESRADELRDELARAADQSPPDGVDSWAQVADYGIAERNIELARDIAGRRAGLFGWLRCWASGADVETAWQAVHSAESALVMVAPAESVRAQLPEIRASMAAALGASDSRVAEYTTELAACGRNLDAAHRQHVRVIKAAVNAASDAAHSNVRNYRNWLLIISFIFVAGLIGLAIAHSSNRNFLYICQAKAGAPGCGGEHSGDVAEIEAAGAAGGLLMAVFALIRLKIYSGPYALPLWVALVRVPSGAAAALVGALLLQGQVFNSLTPQTRSGLLAYAAFFGAAPEVVLRLIDKRVNEATAAARPKSDPLQPVPPAGANADST